MYAETLSREESVAPSNCFSGSAPRGGGVGFFAKGPNAAATLATTAHARARRITFCSVPLQGLWLLRWSALAVFDPREPFVAVQSSRRHCLACVLRLGWSDTKSQPTSRAVQSSRPGAETVYNARPADCLVGFERMRGLES